MKTQKENKLKNIEGAEVTVQVECVEDANKRRKRSTSGNFDVDIEVAVKV